LPKQIAALEAEQKQLTARLEDPNLYQSPTDDAKKISARLAAIDDELLILLERWEALESGANV
jgi:ATP-binding cassette subfamily F protein uup